MREGFVIGDLSLTILVTLAAILSVWTLTGVRRSLPRLLMALGYGGLVYRWWLILIIKGDLIITPWTVIFISLIALGDCLLMLRRRT